jgi:hypothetical protein
MTNRQAKYKETEMVNKKRWRRVLACCTLYMKFEVTGVY